MRFSTILSLLLSVAFAAIAVLGVRGYLRDQASAMLRPEPVAAQNTVVVAAQPLRFGKIVEPTSLKILEWPSNTLPEGSFKSIEEIMGDEGKSRYVMTAIETGEPILSSKITGPGQRATLSAALSPGMKAVSIRVNDVLGVSGFVLPGDRVDVMLTRGVENGQNRRKEIFTDVLLQGLKVLAIDQIADDRTDQPSVVKTVTFEVSTSEAQKLTLAATIGSLSLALRNIASSDVEHIEQISISDLGGGPSSIALQKEKLDAERDERLANIERLVRKVGDDSNKRVVELQKEVERKIEKRRIAPKPKPVVASPIVVPKRTKISVGVYRNSERTEYTVKDSVDNGDEEDKVADAPSSTGNRTIIGNR